MGGNRPVLAGDDPVTIVVGVAGDGDVELVLEGDQSLHGVGRRRVHPDLAIPVHRHEAERLVYDVAHDRQIEMIALGNGRPVVDAGPAERVDAQVNTRAADRVHIDDVPEIAHVGVEIVVPVRRAGAQRLLVWDALHALETVLHQRIGSGLDPARDVGVGGPAVRRVVLEPAVVRRIVRGRDHDTVGQSGAASAVVAQDGMRDRGRGRVFVVLREHNVDAVRRQYLEGAGAGRHRQRVCVDAEKERAVDALAVDGTGRSPR